MDVQSKEAAQIIRDEAKLTVAEGYPRNLSPNVTAVIDMTPSFHQRCKVATINGTTSAATTAILTPGAGKETYAVGALISIIKDATCDAADGTITITQTIDGGAVNFHRLPLMTLTAQEFSQFVPFPRPILLRNSVAVNVTAPTYTVGKFLRTIALYYVEVEPN